MTGFFGRLVVFLGVPLVMAGVLLASVCAAETDYLLEMPAPAVVVAKVSGSNALDTAARRDGALEILRNIVKDLAGPRLYQNRLTPAELGLLVKYQNAQNVETKAGISIIETSGAPATGPDSPSPKWFRLKTHYELDAGLKTYVLGTFFSPAFVAHYHQVKGDGGLTMILPTSLNAPFDPGGSGFFDRLTAALRGFDMSLAAAGVLAVLVAMALMPTNTKKKA